MEDMSQRKPGSQLWLYILFGLILLGLLVWSSLRLFQETPARQVPIEIPGLGLITLTLTTDPFPPLPSGTVQVRLMAENSRGAMVDLGPSLSYTLQQPDEATVLRKGELLQESRGLYLTGIQFPTPGDYWLTFDLESGPQARFNIYVEPAQ